MAGLIAVVRALAPEVGAVVTKGGITAAEVATNGLGGTVATVVGQVETGAGTSTPAPRTTPVVRFGNGRTWWSSPSSSPTAFVFRTGERT